MGKRVPKKPPAEQAGGGESVLSAHKNGVLQQYLVDTGKKGRHASADDIRSMPHRQLIEVCQELELQVTQAVQTICEEQEPQNEEEQEAAVAKVDLALQVLQGAAVLSYDFLQELNSQPPEALSKTAMMLHDNCLLVLGELPSIQDPVTKLCCSWWELNAPGKENLVAQTLPYLLMRANAAGRAVDVKSCYTLREAFNLLDYDDPSSNDVKRLLLQTAMHPAFLHRPEGRKFIAFVLRLHLPMVTELTAIIKNQIPGGRKSVLEAYGDIIFRAWKDSVASPFQYEIEAACIQALMQAAIYASTPTLAAALRQVLAGLHAQKKTAGVDSMLCRLYEPILFRSFSATNADVRRNALLLFLDAFPVRDADAPPEEVDELLTQQFKLLQNCLSDECPLIREAAVRGIIKLLNVYWELIPAPAIAIFVTKLTGDIAFDMAWPGVRAAVLENLTQLVDNPHAQPVLKRALPQLATLLADPVLKVREAMANLLVAVSRTRALHFYEVVPMDSLLAVMASDVPAVANKIQSILVPSYFPNPEEGSARIAMLLKRSPIPGQAFCQYLVSSFCSDSAEEEEDAPLQGFRASVPIEHITRLASDLKNHLLATCTELVAAKPKAKKQKPGKAGSKKGAAGKRRKAAEAGVKAEQDDALEEGDEAADSDVEVPVDDENETPESWSSIVAGLAHLAGGLKAAVEQEQCSCGDIEAIFEADELMLMLDACPTNAARVSVLTICTHLPFLNAAGEVRNKLFTDLAANRPPFPAESAIEGKDLEVDLLGPCFSCLCAAPSGAKLVHMVLKSLGLRPSGVIHAPVGHAHQPADQDEGDEAGDEIRCHACNSQERADTMLLCDGCDAAYHMDCVRPALTAVPEGDWFCHSCETELRACTMSAADGIRCLSAILTQTEGRELVRSHHHFDTLLAGLKSQSHQQAQLLIRQLTHAVAAAPEADAAAPVAGRKGKGKGRGKKAVAAAAATVEQADTTVDAVSSVHMYCKAALHMVLMSVTSPDSDDKEENEPDAKEATLRAAAEAVLEALDMCEQVVEACVDSEAPTAAMLSALRFAADVLGVMCDAQQLGVMDVSQGGHGVQRMCDLGTHVATVCARTLQTGPDQKPCSAVKDAFSHMLVLSKHLVASVARPQGDVANNAAGSEGPSQQLEALLNASADDAAGDAGAELDGLAQHLLTQVLSPPCSGLLSSLRSQVSSLISLLIDKECKVSKGWMMALVGAVGAALAESDELREDAEATAAAQPASPSPNNGAAAEPSTARTTATGARSKAGSVRTARRTRRSMGSGNDAEVDEEDQDVQAERDNGDAGWEGQQGGDEEAGVVVKGSRPTALKVLQEVDPSACALTNVLLGLTRLKQVQDPMLDLLAGMAVEGWRAGQASAALGALALMSMLGVADLSSRRLRLTGAEANTLIKLQMLAQEVEASQEVEEEEEDVQAPALAPQTMHLLRLVMGTAA